VAFERVAIAGERAPDRLDHHGCLGGGIELHRARSAALVERVLSNYSADASHTGIVTPAKANNACATLLSAVGRG